MRVLFRLSYLLILTVLCGACAHTRKAPLSQNTACPSSTSQTTSKCVTPTPDIVHSPVTQCKGRSAFAFVIDKSGSTTHNVVENFKRILSQTLPQLPQNSYVTIIAFDNNPLILAKMSPISSFGLEKLLARLRLVFSSGQTNALPAIDQAQRALNEVKVPCKSLVFLSDGKLPDLSPYYTEMIKLMASQGITTSLGILGSQGQQLNSTLTELPRGDRNFFIYSTAQEWFETKVAQEILNLSKAS